MEKKAYLINFDHPFPDTVITKLKEEHPEIENLILIEKRILINWQLQPYKQCISIRRSLENQYPDIFSGLYPVIVNLPGLSLAAVYLINEIEGKLRSKPQILEMIKHKASPDDLFPKFEFRRVLNLELNKNVTKNNITEQGINGETV
jgi:hypothetical protein